RTGRRWGRSRGLAASAAFTGSAWRGCGAGGTARGSFRGARGGIDRGALFIARRHRQTVEDAWRADDRGRAGFRERHLNHFESKPRRVRIVESPVLAPLQLVSRTHARRTRDV